MRQHLATLCPVVLASGCSWLYNPDRIDEVADAAIPDTMIDADPSNLMLTGVESPPLREGEGDEGSRPAVLVIRGSNIISGATIAITPATGTALVELVEDPVVSTQFDLIAVKVIARVDPDLPAGQTVDLVVKVTQPSPLGGTVEQMTMWQLEGLDELEGAAQTVDTAAPREYSRVAVDTLTYSGTGKLIVRATASISVANAINVSANGATPGPGGGAGGASNPESDGTGPGRGKKGAAGSAGGGGGGFAISGEDGGDNPGSGGQQTGDLLITRYADNMGSGGGGSNYPGGGGGGTLELTAGGNLTVGMILATGAKGGSGGLALTVGGGGGSGGCVVLRSGATTTVSGFDISGGAAGTGALAGKDGGAGRAGRARVDAVDVSGDLGTAHRGIMFDAATPLIVRDTMPDVTVLGSAGDIFDVQRTSANFAPLGDKQALQFGGSTSITQAVPALEPGFNRVCAVPANSGLGNPESRNCVDVAYVP